jgi:hypothetical protein
MTYSVMKQCDLLLAERKLVAWRICLPYQLLPDDDRRMFGSRIAKLVEPRDPTR